MSNKAVKGINFSISSGLFPAVTRKIPLNTTFIMDPSFSENERKLPLKKKSDNSAITDRYTD
jgi:hypothetical protein